MLCVTLRRWSVVITIIDSYITLYHTHTHTYTQAYFESKWLAHGSLAMFNYADLSFSLSFLVSLSPPQCSGHLCWFTVKSSRIISNPTAVKSVCWQLFSLSNHFVCAHSHTHIHGPIYKKKTCLSFPEMEKKTICCMIVFQLIIFQFLLFLYSTIMWGFLRIREYFLDVNRYYIGHILKEPQISTQPAHFKHHRTESEFSPSYLYSQQVFNQTNIPSWNCVQSTGLSGVEAESRKNKINPHHRRYWLYWSRLSSEGMYVILKLML